MFDSRPLEQVAALAQTITDEGSQAVLDIRRRSEFCIVGADDNGEAIVRGLTGTEVLSELRPSRRALRSEPHHLKSPSWGRRA